ncbi:MAG: hypothetical protein Q9163_003759 [Psora crenata]
MAVDDALFTDLLETDFLHLANITRDTDWQPQNYTVTPALARGPYGKNASLSNVIANPLKSQYDWAGQGTRGGDAGLQLFVRGDEGPAGSLVPMAELVTTRDDILYGSFRAAIKITSLSGTCGAFFWYYNDTQEIDIELLSAQQNSTSPHPVNLVLQSPASAQSGFDAAKTDTFALLPLPFDPADGFHEYRFDWSRDAVAFYADGELLTTMNRTAAVPSSPGHVTLSHWSNGNPEWSAGPPAGDAVMTVSYLKAYFNSSLPGRQRDWSARCNGDFAVVNATCPVPELDGAPQGNESGRTWFYTMQRNSSVNQTVGDGEGGDAGKSEGVAVLLSWVSQGRMMMLALALALLVGAGLLE